MPLERREEFTTTLQKVHTGLYPQSEQDKQEQNEETTEPGEVVRSDDLLSAQMKLAKLSMALARVGRSSSGRLDLEIARDADRIIHEVVDTMTNELRSKLKRGEEIADDDPLKRGMKYLRDLDTRFNAGDIAARLKRINQLTGYKVDK